MQHIWRPRLVIGLALLVPILPFFAFGEALEARITGWLDPPPAPAAVALATIGVLAMDVFLPVPSSVVSTFAGSQLGVLAATVASWLGMTAGAMFAFWLAKSCGRPLAARLSSGEDLDEMDRLAGRYGGWVLIVTRPLPILAEAAVLFLGTTSLGWRQFLPAVFLSNLGIALVYSVLGRWAQSQGELPLAFAASIALPLAAATIARSVLARRQPERDIPPTTDPPLSS